MTGLFLRFNHTPADRKLIALIQNLPPGKRSAIIKALLLSALTNSTSSSPKSSPHSTPLSSSPSPFENLQDLLTAHLPQKSNH